jgi:PqqD family protein of HPr-rel-A system
MANTYVAVTGLEAAPLADGGAVIFSPKTGKFVMLNRTAERLWTRLQAARTEDDLVADLCRTYTDAGADPVRRDVQAVLESLRGLDLVRPQLGVADGGPSAAAQGTSPRDGEAYAAPAAQVLGEEDLLKVFQLTAAEISVAGCWWAGCRTGNP